jgi:hypothetical protein
MHPARLSELAMDTLDLAEHFGEAIDTRLVQVSRILRTVMYK